METEGHAGFGGGEMVFDFVMCQDVFDDEEADASAVGVFAVVKDIKEGGNVRFFQRRAGIFDIEPVIFDKNTNRSLLIGVFDGVTDEVGEKFLKSWL